MPRHPHARPGPTDRGRLRPRVAVLGPGPSTRVEMVRLPDDAGVGSLFDHAGTRWQVTLVRTHGRVVFAEPSDVVGD